MSKMPIFKVDGSVKNAITFRPFQTGDYVYRFGKNQPSYVKKNKMEQWWNAAPELGTFSPKTGGHEDFNFGQIERTNLPEAEATGGAAGGASSAAPPVENQNNVSKLRIAKPPNTENPPPPTIPERFRFFKDKDTDENLAEVFHVQNVQLVPTFDPKGGLTVDYVRDYDGKKVIALIDRSYKNGNEYGIGVFDYNTYRDGKGVITTESGNEYEVEMDEFPIIYSFDPITEGGGRHKKRASRRHRKQKKQKKTKRVVKRR